MYVVTTLDRRVNRLKLGGKGREGMLGGMRGRDEISVELHVRSKEAAGERG